jgi:uncharacterized Tic20 family protein
MNQEVTTESTVPREARQWAMIVHIIALTGLITGVGFLLGPLIVWLLKKEDHPFVDGQGKESVNFQITMFIALCVCGLLSLIIIGIFLAIIVGLLMVIFPIIGAVKANDGVAYKYPFSLRLIK